MIDQRVHALSPSDICVRHLSLLATSPGLAPVMGPDGNTGGLVAWSIDHPPAPPGDLGPPAEEVIAQAASGLMAVHGREVGRPRRLGLDVASGAAGILGAQGVLAAMVGRSRGHRIASATTSTLAGALAFLSHHVAAATSSDPWMPDTTGPAPGPPFCTADGHWVELEALTPEAWKSFWVGLGVPTADLGPSWLALAFRPNVARCRLPPGLHEAVASRSLAEVLAVAASSGAAVCRLRGYAELLAGRSGAPPYPRGTGPAQATPPWSITAREPASAGPRSSSNGGKGPLEGVRVVEATSRVQGPLAGLLLAMLGADVTKVEPPGGDGARLVPPTAGSEGAAFLAYNRGKSFVELDYRTPIGRCELEELAAGADVFLHNWRTGRAEELGLDAESLGRINPSLIHAQAAGWGEGERCVPVIATDSLVQAHCGYGDGLNPGDEPAAPSSLTLVDVAGGLVACEAVLAALLLRERTGAGSAVTTSLMSAAMDLQAPVLDAMAAGREQGRRAGRPTWGPLERPVETADGFVAVGADGRARSVLRRLCGVADAAGDGASTEALIARRLGHLGAAEWVDRLGEAGVPAAVVVEDLATLPGDPCVGPLLQHVEGACWAPGPPWRFGS